MDSIISVKDVEMHFNMSKEKIDSIKEYFIKLSKRQLRYEDFVALDGVSVDIKKGEIFGIVGLNGSGKSTILKVISGILKPTKGSVEVRGSISPLIELGAGFDLDLTAKENIYLDVPMKNYSSGMVARIGFSVATIVKPDILIVDEILSVGDFLFQKKCEERINNLMQGGTTVLIVSHSLDQIKRLCDRVMWLDKGKVKMIGDMSSVCEQYEAYHK